MTSKPRSSFRRARPSSRLIAHDIAFACELTADGEKRVQALVECERQGRCVRTDICAHCDRFVRIEPHEAGYLLLCHAEDVLADDEPAPLFPPDRTREDQER